MRGKVASLTVVAVLSVVSPLVGAQSVDEVISKNIDAHGGLEKLAGVKSLRITGRMWIGEGREVPYVLELKRPMQMRMEFTVQGTTGVRAFDGRTGWQILPFAASKGPELMSAGELREATQMADIDGPLVDYKEKGHRVELKGKGNVEGTECYTLRITLRSGDVRYLYLDSRSFLETKAVGRGVVQDAETEIETSFGNYKREDGGIILPHFFETRARPGAYRERVIVENVEVNPNIDSSRFKMP